MSSAGEPIVEAAGITRSFGELDVIKPLDLIVGAGEYLAITGASGSGKSTLLNLIGLLDRPTSGSLAVHGMDTEELSDTERSALRGRVNGFVFQAFHLMDVRTALANVELGMLYRGLPAVERRARAEAALDQVGLGAMLGAFPATMSGGERQRVAIARALAADVSLLLADEPTGNLDSETGERVLDLFDRLHLGGLALVVVTHNHEVAERAQRVLRMVDGVLHE